MPEKNKTEKAQEHKEEKKESKFPEKREHKEEKTAGKFPEKKAQEKKEAQEQKAESKFPEKREHKEEKTAGKFPEKKAQEHKQESKFPEKKEHKEEKHGHKEHEKEHKAESKSSDEKKEEKKTEKKEEPKKKKIVFEKYVNPKKSPEAKKLREIAKKRARRLFRGRFGQRNMIRNIRNEKWQRWHKARGLDTINKNSDGFRVKIGFRSPKAIRGIHPSGYKELLVENIRQVEEAGKQKGIALKISGRVGLRKRQELLKKAKEHKLWVLNA